MKEIAKHRHEDGCEHLDSSEQRTRDSKITKYRKMFMIRAVFQVEPPLKKGK